MKLSHIICHAALLPTLVAAGEKPSAGGIGPGVLPGDLRPALSNLPTDEELIERRNARSPERPKPVPAKPSGFDVRDLSMYLGAGEVFTILPKGCVIHCPDRLTDRVLAAPAGKAAPWREFLSANRAWIATWEVTAAQARGEEALSGEDRAAFAARGMIVIATLRGNPVTVLPFRPRTDTSQESP